MSPKVRILCSDAPLIAVAQLKPHPENDNRQSKFMFEKLVSAIRNDGFADPIIVRTGNEKGPFPFHQVLGGEHRLRAAKKLGMTHVPITNLGIVYDLAARKLIISLNKIRGDTDEDALAGLVRAIQDEGGQDALGDLALDADKLEDLLDEPPPPAAAGEESLDRLDETPSTTKSSTRDLTVILGMARMKSEDLANLLGAARAWAAGLPNQDEPAWPELQALFVREAKKRRR